jgi:ABC-type uncharacterized transport system fused permease/ATPase subunit
MYGRSTIEYPGLHLWQTAAAFAAVQGAFNWLVDNYPRLAEWASSASRVGILLLGFDLLTSGQPRPNVP